MQRRAVSRLNDDISPQRQAEFERLYRSHATAVRRHLAYLTGDDTLAEDLAQETFGKLYQRLVIDDDAELLNALAWLRTVASNLAYNHFRAESRRTTREIVTADSPRAADIDDVLDVRRVLGVLSDRDRIVLLLRHSGFTYAEVAEAVDIAPSSVGTILARAQRRFREAYEGTGHQAGEKE